MTPDDLTIEELVAATGEDQQLLLSLVESYDKLLSLVNEMSLRNHELYMAWTAALTDTEQTPPSPGFFLKIVKNGH